MGCSLCWLTRTLKRNCHTVWYYFLQRIAVQNYVDHGRICIRNHPPERVYSALKLAERIVSIGDHAAFSQKYGDDVSKGVLAIGCHWAPVIGKFFEQVVCIVVVARHTSQWTGHPDSAACADSAASAKSSHRAVRILKHSRGNQKLLRVRLAVVI